MLLPKHCPRCRGDLVDDEWLGEVDLACIQCGYRRPITPAQRDVTQTTPQAEGRSSGLAA